MLMSNMLINTSDKGDASLCDHRSLCDFYVNHFDGSILLLVVDARPFHPYRDHCAEELLQDERVTTLAGFEYIGREMALPF